MEACGYILEFKIADKEESNLEEMANYALEQIKVKKYDIALQDREIPKIVKYAVGFNKKEALVVLAD